MPLLTAIWNAALNGDPVGIAFMGLAAILGFTGIILNLGKGTLQ